MNCIHWIERSTGKLLTISSRKKIPDQGSLVALSAQKQKLKIKIVGVEFSHFGLNYDVYVEIV